MKHFAILLVSLLPMVSPAQSDDLRRILDLRGYWKFSIGDDPNWAAPNYDDQSWERIFVPSPWENEGFGGFDGYAWYRITFDAPSYSGNLQLVLGYIDDVDEVFLNGELIGFSGAFPPNFYTAYDSYRQYSVPSGLIRKGEKNVIAIRVFDTILDGGMIKGEVGLYHKKNEPENMIALEGIWSFKEGDSQIWKEENYDDSDWNKIIVPSFWRSLKKSHIEGVAWYRKDFYLDASLANEPKLAVVLGKIDDFDETYINGVLIGSTNDGRPLGFSDSWRKSRIYVIPKEALNNKGKNTIAVRVKDVGGNAGIYEGPLAIIPVDTYRQLLRSNY